MSTVKISELKVAVQQLNELCGGRYNLEGSYGLWKLTRCLENSSATVDIIGFETKKVLLKRIYSYMSGHQDGLSRH